MSIQHEERKYDTWKAHAQFPKEEYNVSNYIHLPYPENVISD